MARVFSSCNWIERKKCEQQKEERRLSPSTGPVGAQREKKSIVQWMTQGGSIPGGEKVSSVLSGSAENAEQEEKGE